MKKSVLTLLTILILFMLALIFISPDGGLSIGELLIMVIVLIVGVFVSNKIGE